MKSFVVLVSLMILPLCLQAQTRINSTDDCVLELNKEGGTIKNTCLYPEAPADASIKLGLALKPPPPPCHCPPRDPRIIKITSQPFNSKKNIIIIKVVESGTKCTFSYITTPLSRNKANTLAGAWRNSALKVISVPLKQPKTSASGLR